jgi:hypothetical protein
MGLHDFADILGDLHVGIQKPVHIPVLCLGEFLFPSFIHGRTWFIVHIENTREVKRRRRYQICFRLIFPENQVIKIMSFKQSLVSILYQSSNISDLKPAEILQIKGSGFNLKNLQSECKTYKLPKATRRLMTASPPRLLNLHFSMSSVSDRAWLFFTMSNRLALSAKLMACLS